MKDSDVFIGGSVNLTIGGSVRHLVKGNYHLEVEGNYTQKIHKNMRTKIGAGEIGGNLEEEIKGTHSFNIDQAVKGRIGKDVNVTTEGDETRINNGKYNLAAKSDIFATTTGGTLTLNASGNVSIDTVSGIFGIKSGTTMKISSGTVLDITAGTILDLNSGDGSPSSTNVINLN